MMIYEPIYILLYTYVLYVSIYFGYKVGYKSFQEI